MWKLNNILLNNQIVKDEIKGKSKSVKSNESGNKIPKLMSYSKISFKREVYSDKWAHFKKKRKKGDLNNLSSYLMDLYENISQISRRKKIT